MPPRKVNLIDHCDAEWEGLQVYLTIAPQLARRSERTLIGVRDERMVCKVTRQRRNSPRGA